MKTYYRYTDRHGLRVKKVSALERFPHNYHETPEAAVKAAMNSYAKQEVIASNKLAKASHKLNELKEITAK